MISFEKVWQAINPVSIYGLRNKQCLRSLIGGEFGGGEEIDPMKLMVGVGSGSGK